MDLRARSDRLVRRMDSDLSEDTRLVLDAAAALDVKEYELFRLAYRRRFEAEPADARLERVFVRYMYFGEAPGYIQQFAREVAAHARAGCLKPHAFGAAPAAAPPPHPYGRAVVASVLVLAMAFSGLLIVTRTGMKEPNIGCAGGPGMGFVEQAARQFTGKPDPFNCR